jgi:hypothetical protein
MKQLLHFFLLVIIASPAAAQTQWLPDTVVAIYGKDFISIEDKQLFEFSDGSKAMLIYSNDSLSNVVGGVNYSIPGEPYGRVLYQLDANYQFVRAGSSPCYKYRQVNDSLYGIATVLWNDTINLNPLGTPVWVTDTNTMSNSYLVVYDKSLQLKRYKHVNQNKFSGGNVKLVAGGKIYVNFFEKDDHPVNGSFAMGRQRLVTYDMSFNVLHDKTYFDRLGTTWNFDLLNRFTLAPSGNFYGLFKEGSSGESFDIALLPQQTQLRPVSNDAPAWLVKYDANLNVLWDVQLKSTAPTYFWQIDGLFESPSQDSLLLIGMVGIPGMVFNAGALTDTLVVDTVVSYREKFYIMLSKTTGQLGRYKTAHGEGIFEEGAGMWRFLRSFPDFFGGTGPLHDEYLNFLTGTFPVPDSQSVIAWYDDATTGIPAYYRMLGQMGPMTASYVYDMVESQPSQTLYMWGLSSADLRLDSSITYVLPSLTANTHFFLGAFKSSTVLDRPELKEALDFALYPNPTTDHVHVTVQAGKAHTVQLLDLEGRILRSDALPGRSDWEWDISDLAAGVYFVQVMDGSGQRFGRRLIKH